MRHHSGGDGQCAMVMCNGLPNGMLAMVGGAGQQVGGLLGGLFIRANSAWCKLKRSGAQNDKAARQFAAGSPKGPLLGQIGRWMGRNPIKEAVVVAAISSVLCYQHPYLRYEATDLMSALFSECRTEEEATEVMLEFRDLCGVDPGEDHKLLLWLVVRACMHRPGPPAAQPAALRPPARSERTVPKRTNPCAPICIDYRRCHRWQRR